MKPFAVGLASLFVSLVTATPVIFVAGFRVGREQPNPITRVGQLPYHQVVRIEQEMSQWSNDRFAANWDSYVNALRVTANTLAPTRTEAQRQLDDMQEIVRTRILGGAGQLMDEAAES